MTWPDIENVWIEFLKTKDQNVYKKYRKLVEEYAEKVWGKNYKNEDLE